MAITQWTRIVNGQDGDTVADKFDATFVNIDNWQETVQQTIDTVPVIQTQLKVVDKTGINIDTIHTFGLYSVNTQTPDGLAGTLEIRDYHTNIEEHIYTSQYVYRREYSRSSLSYTAWVKQELPSIISFSVMTPRVEQTVTSNLWTKIDNTPVDTNESPVAPILSYGTQDLDYDVTGKKTLVKTAGTYRVSGVINIDATINDIFIFGIMWGVPSPIVPQYIVTQIGMNSSNVAVPTSIPFSFVQNFAANDDVTLWINTSGTKIQTYSTMLTIEKLPY